MMVLLSNSEAWVPLVSSGQDGEDKPRVIQRLPWFGRAADQRWLS
jgi:hypothetical protein